MRRRAAWSTCRSCSTSRARSDAQWRRGARCRRGRSSTASTAAQDRVALIFFGERRARRRCRCPPAAGSTRPESWPTSPTACPAAARRWSQGLYRGWDELRSVPNGQQSGLRVIVLFTDGASNSVPGIYDRASATSRGLSTSDFPKQLPDPDNQTQRQPVDRRAVRHAERERCVPARSSEHRLPWNTTAASSRRCPCLPLTSFHSYHRSGGIPTSFPLSATR